MSFATTWMEVPAERPSWPPRPGTSSTLCTVVPVGMALSGRALPGAMSAVGTRGDRGPHGEPGRRQDVALLAVQVVEERDVRAAVGVVLDRRDLGGHAVLAALEVDLPVLALVAAAAVAGGDAAVVVAPAGLPQALDERLLGLGLGDRLVLEPGGEAPARAGGLVLLDGHQAPSSCPSNSSIVSSAWSVTTAFFQRRRNPALTPRRFGLGLTYRVRTSRTRTPKISSTAWRTCVLFARSATRKVYLLAASRA